MEHLDNITLDMIKYLLELLIAVTTAFCGIFVWLGTTFKSTVKDLKEDFGAKFEGFKADFNTKVDKIGDGLTSLNKTVVMIKDEFNEKHTAHSLDIAVMKEHLNHAVERRRGAEYIPTGK